MSNTIIVNEVSRSFNEVKALSDISLELKPGIYGLIGPNGAGKSTLIRLISTLDHASDGSITYNNKDIHELKDKYRNIIGLMPQNQRGYDLFSGFAFLHYMALLKGITKKDANKQIEQLVKQVSLEDSIHRKIKTYSGGMRQRLMFVQALLGDPKIVMLDEPTAGLDPYERIRLRNYISQIAHNRIVLIATHVMQDIESIVDTVILLKKGVVVFDGSGEELLDTITHKVFETKVEEEKLQWYQANYRVSRVYKYDNQYMIRYIDDTRTDGILIPNFEDAYLYYMVDYETTIQ